MGPPASGHHVPLLMPPPIEAMNTGGVLTGKKRALSPPGMEDYDNTDDEDGGSPVKVSKFPPFSLALLSLFWRSVRVVLWRYRVRL